MELIPAIDLLGGEGVRLTRGEYDRKTVYSGDPVGQAVAFERAGAKRVHVIDLSGARAGSPQHLAVVEGIAARTRLAVEFGGGVRTAEDIAAAFRAGARRVILGTAAFRDPALLEEAIERYREAIIVSVDARGAHVMGEGWSVSLSLTVEEAVERLRSQGVREIVFTDTDRDGTLQGVDLGRFRPVLAAARGFAVQFAGGVRDLADVRALKALEAEGLGAVIAGKALYEGTLELAAGLAVARGLP